MSSKTLFPDFKALGRPILLLTVLFIIKDEKILLGYKKRGFGKGKWNGFGGKVNVQNETIEEGAQRELSEECGLCGIDIKKIGVIHFEFDQKYENKILEVHVFRCSEFSGTITESDEMKPQWFNIKDIPYDNMWIDDKFWFQYMLKNEPFKAHFIFSDFDNIEKHEIKLLEDTKSLC